MKLSGSTFVWLAGIGFVWAMSSAQAAGVEPGAGNLDRFSASARPVETFRASGDALRLPRGRSTAYPRLASGLLRPDRQRAAGFLMARSPVERVRIGRTPQLRRAGGVPFNRFVFRREGAEALGR